MIMPQNVEIQVPYVFLHVLKPKQDGVTATSNKLGAGVADLRWGTMNGK